MNEQLKEAVSEAIREALGGALDCGRVWSAWGVGTMSEDDFSPVADDPERVAEITDAALAAVAAAGNQHRRWWHNDMWHPRTLEDAIEQMSEMRDDWAEMGRRLGFDSYTDVEPLLSRASELAGQVGEVQGDARAALESAMPYLETLHSIVGGEARTSVWRCIERGRLALAARQPGAQVPYGFVLDWKHAPASFTTKAGVAAEHRDYKNCTVVPVYRAPPAQGIDLGEFRPLIARSLAEWHEDDGNVMWWAWCGRDWAGEPAWCGTPNDSDWPGYHTHWTQHPVQPALIDGQRDAAPGVGS